MEGNINEDIKNSRERLGLTQEEMADTLGINRKTIGEWESGQSTPNKTSRRKLSNLFGVEITAKGIAKTHISNMKIEKPQQLDSETDWFKKTIETLIHQNGETILEFRVRSKDEIENLRGDKAKLFELLAVRLKATQDSK